MPIKGCLEQSQKVSLVYKGKASMACDTVAQSTPDSLLLIAGNLASGSVEVITDHCSTLLEAVVPTPARMWLMTQVDTCNDGSDCNLCVGCVLTLSTMILSCHTGTLKCPNEVAPFSCKKGLGESCPGEPEWFCVLSGLNCALVLSAVLSLLCVAA
jgi:hypothetical protein